MQQEFKPLHSSDMWGTKEHNLEMIDYFLL